MNRKLISILAAFLFSVIIWGSVSLSGDYFVSVVVPVRIIDLPDNYIADGISAREVSVRLKGEGWRLSSLSLGSHLEYKVSAGLDSGRVFINLNKSISENEWLTSRIQIYDISPDTISARIERVFEKKVPVIPAFDLQFKPGYGLASEKKLSPDSIVVYGTRRRLKELKGIPTVKRAITNLERKTEEKVELAQLQGLTYSTQNCTATLDVQKIVDKQFPKINIEIHNVPGSRDLLLFPNSIDIVLRGGINVLGKMNSNVINASVDYNIVLTDTTGTVEPVIRIPDYTTLVNKQPDKIKYIIKKY